MAGNLNDCEGELSAARKRSDVDTRFDRIVTKSHVPAMIIRSRHGARYDGRPQTQRMTLWQYTLTHNQYLLR